MQLVKIERFQSANIEVIHEWLRLRNLPESCREDFPRLGFLALIEKQPIAAAFFRRCEGNVGIFDSLITDPRATSKIRHEAIEKLVQCILEVAREFKITKLLAFSIDSGTLERGVRHGFVKQTHTVMSLELPS